MSERIYIVVLRNLDLADRKLCMTSGRIASHAVHVGAVLTHASGIDVADKDIIILSVAGKQELEQLCCDLNRERINYVEYRDVDRVIDGEHMTAIATYPIEKNSSDALKHLQPWKCACNETTFSRSSVAEHSASNREVASSNTAEVGSIPAGRASNDAL